MFEALRVMNPDYQFMDVDVLGILLPHAIDRSTDNCLQLIVTI